MGQGFEKWGCSGIDLRLFLPNPNLTPFSEWHSECVDLVTQLLFNNRCMQGKSLQIWQSHGYLVIRHFYFLDAKVLNELPLLLLNVTYSGFPIFPDFSNP